MGQPGEIRESDVSDAERKLFADVNAFAFEKVNTAAASWSVGGSPDASLFLEAAGLGLTGIEVAAEHGGRGFGYTTKLKVFTLLAQADFGFALSLVNSHNVAARLAQSAPLSLRKRFLPGLLDGSLSACTALSEPGAGSDFAAITTTAAKVSGGWLIDGEKSWIVNARHAGVAIIFVQTLQAGAGDPKGIGAFVVDLTAAGVERYAIDSAFSQTSIGSGGIHLNKVKVTDEHLLLPPGKAFKLILNEINGARIYVAGMCNGMLQAAIEQVKAYGATRHTFGEPLQNHSIWSDAVNKAETDLHESEASVAEAAACIDRQEDVQLAAINAKIHAVQLCQRHLPGMLHAMGAEGLKTDYCFTRHIAASQIAGFTDGATWLLQARAEKLQQQTNQRTD